MAEREIHIVCNKCGKELDTFDIQENFSIVRSLGYGTQYDGEDLNIRLCCKCMETLIKQCVISPVSERR